MRGAVAVAQLEQASAGEPVEDLELGRGQGEPAVLVLAVEGEQPRAERAQVGGRGRAARDEGARPPRAADPPAEHDLVGVLGQPRGDLGQLGIVERAGRELEDALDPGLVRAGPHDLRPRPAAHQQVERVREHGLARPGLARDRVQPLAEAQLGALDQEQVLDPQLEEHTPVLAPGADGFAPSALSGPAPARAGPRRAAGGGAPGTATMSRPRTSSQRRSRRPARSRRRRAGSRSGR